MVIVDVHVICNMMDHDPEAHNIVVSRMHEFDP